MMSFLSTVLQKLKDFCTFAADKGTNNWATKPFFFIILNV